MTASATVADHLVRYGGIVAAELETYLPSAEPPSYLYDLLPRSVMREGKALRPSICLATSSAFGADLELSIGPAVAIELAHNAFLVHDDVQDGSHRRRGQTALHAEIGLPLAINVGDALAILSFEPLLDADRRLGSAMASRLLREFHHTIATTVEGQALDLGWRRDNICDLTADDYLGMVLRKTCCYTTIHPLRVGALVATRGRADLAALTQFGFHLGAAFQVQDDVLDLVAPPPEYGKDVWGDLYEGKRTLPVIHLLAACTGAERGELVRFLGMGREARSTDGVAWVHSLLVRYESIDFAREFAKGIAEAARDSFDRAFSGVAPNGDVDFLAALVDFVIERSS